MRDRSIKGSALLALWRTVTLRHWRSDPIATLLLLSLLSVGVGTYLSIRLANRAAVESFATFNASLEEPSDWIIRSPTGRLPVSHLGPIREAFNAAPVKLLPLLETSAIVYSEAEAADLSEATRREPLGRPALRLVGLDFTALAGQATTELTELFAPENETRSRADGTGLLPLWIAAPIAETNALKAGDTCTLLVNETAADYRIAGILPERTPQGETPANLALIDIADLQAASGLSDWVDRVEVVFPQAPFWDEVLQTGLEQLRADPRLLLIPPSEENAQGEAMTAAFRLNLSILALIALLVALYLIAQALDAVVVRRRQETAIMRSLGVTPSILRIFWLGEFFLLGLIGGVMGLVVGWALAQFTAGAVADTVNALYFSTGGSRGVSVAFSDVALGLLLGIGGSLLAGYMPLREIASTPAAQVMAQGNFTRGHRLFYSPWPGIALVFTGGLLWFSPPLTLDGGARFPLGGFTAAFCWLIGGTLIASSSFTFVARLLRPFERPSATLRLARAHLENASSRHRLAAAGLFVAVAMAAAMSFLVGSFAKTMEDWIDVRFRADLFLSSAAAGGAGDEFLLRSATLTAIAALPEVAEADPFRLHELTFEGKQTFIGVSRHDLLGHPQPVLWIQEPTKSAPADTTPVYVNEAFTLRFDRTVGDRLALPTPVGMQPVTIVGIFADYGNERGLIWLDWTKKPAWFLSEEANALSLFLKPGADPLLVADQIKAAHPGLVPRDNVTLRTLVRTIFRQTFAVTEALKIIAILVAMGGLALALGNLQRESKGELQTLRSLGMRRAEIARVTGWESVGIAFVGTFGGILAGFGLGALLIFVINKQSFGWTLRWHTPWLELGLLAATALTLAFLVGYAVGWRYAALKK